MMMSHWWWTKVSLYATLISEDCEIFDLKEAVPKFIFGDLPETYESGQEEIDAILISSRLEALDGGYSEPGVVIDSSDNRQVWLDITEQICLARNFNT